MRLALVPVVAFLLATLSFAAESQASIRKYELNIPRQTLDGALKDLAQQTGLQIARMSDVIDGTVTVGPISGSLTTEEALTSMLKAHGLSFKVVNDKTIAIVDPNSDTANALEGLSERVAGSAPDRSRLGVAQSASTKRLAQAENQSSAASGSEDAAAKADRAAARERATPNTSDQLDEVVVTATKRAERVHDVPMSITALSADEIDKRGAVSSGDYLRGLPGVTQSDSIRGQIIVIRGMESVTGDQNFASGPTTATYFGETPTTNAAGLGGGSNVDLKLVDIERVEVLRGPQGSAFGDSSMGGAVRIIPAAPKLDLYEADMGVGYSSTSGTGGSNYHVRVAGNLPLITDKLAVRAVGYQYDDSGYYRNRASTNTAFQNSLIIPWNGQDLVADSDEVGDTHVLGGRVAALFRASDALRFTLSYISQKAESDGLPIATSGTYEQAAPLVVPAHAVRGEQKGVYDTDIDIANAMAEYDLGWGDVVATYSHTDSGSIYAWPFVTASGAAWPISLKTDSTHSENVAELRLTTRLQGAWNFLGGLFYERVKDGSVQEYLWWNETSTAFANPNHVFTRAGDRFDGRDLKQKAVFGEVSWSFLQNWTLTGGVRKYEYDRTSQLFATGAFYGLSGINEQGVLNISDENFRANLSFKPGSATHLYAGWSQGFRLGRPQGGLPSVCDANGDGIADITGVPIASTRRVNPDSVDSYELGGKFALLERRVTLDAAVFRMEWHGVPFRVSGGGGSCSFSFNTNAGDALSQGAELQASFQIAAPLRLDIGGSWVDAKMAEAVISGNGAILARKGNRLPGSPEVNASLGVQYDFQLAGLRSLVRLDSIYVGDYYYTVLEVPTTKAGDYVKFDLTARLAAGNFNIDVFARNLTNQDAFTAREGSLSDFYGYRLRPRTIGMQVGFKF